jgi:hypothetical protein
MNDTLIYGLSTLFVGIIGLLIRYGFKSKCTDVNMCCGMIAIKRDVNAEIEEEKMELENGIKEENKV